MTETSLLELILDGPSLALAQRRLAERIEPLEAAVRRALDEPGPHPSLPAQAEELAELKSARAWLRHAGEALR
ncbi:hypothetical protein [Dactylosporangium sp. CA-233914]|uniref:hypothetical protein n=1 Tax=Dactylosporangium sp. CA-233914 TaxID=3239934 RepID=UPI003D8EF611